MSKLQAKPLINAAIESLSDEQKGTLQSLLNGSQKTPTFRSFLNPSAYVTDSDEGVSFISLETKEGVRTGYLIYTDDYCVLAAYAPNEQQMQLYVIDPDERTCEPSGQWLSILELRVTLGLASGQSIEDIIPQLYGKFVRIMEPPASTTLTEEEKTILTNGVFINGEFLGFVNPMFFPALVTGPGNSMIGIIIGRKNSELKLGTYAIDSSNVIAYREDWISDLPAGALTIGKRVRLDLDRLNGKAFPANPSNTGTFTFKDADGTLRWAQDATIIAPAYDNTATYAVGDLVTYQGSTYRCTTAIDTAEDWTAAHWAIQNVQQMLQGKFVRVMDASDITTPLTEDIENAIRGGVFVNGTLGDYINPVLYPTDATGYSFIIGSANYGALDFGYYRIDNHELKILAQGSNPIRLTPFSMTGCDLNLLPSRDVVINPSRNISLKGKNWPANPSGTGTFVLKCVDGVLTWVEEV